MLLKSGMQLFPWQSDVRFSQLHWLNTRNHSMYETIIDLSLDDVLAIEEYNASGP